VVIEEHASGEAARRKGLRWALLALALYSILALLTLIPENGILRYDTSQIETIVHREYPDEVRLQRVIGKPPYRETARPGSTPSFSKGGR
jgi:hypothetical protein